MTIREKIVYLRKSGLKLKEISEIVKLGRGTVSYYLKNIKKEQETPEERSRRKSLHVINWKKEKKKLLVDYKGGKCEICGYNKCIEALDFHHIDPTQKDFSVSSHSFSFKRMKEEVDKCILLCSNCHREFHAGCLKLE